jgi:polysaccharide export outer membrane protein
MTANCRSRNTANSGASFVTRLAGLAVVCLVVAGGASAQSAQAAEQRGDGGSAAAATPSTAAAALPTGYVIGAEDVLTIVFWRDKDMSGDFIVRPDGKISLPLLNDVQAAGLTPEQMREQLEKSAQKYIEDPNASVVVKEIHSRKVFITGNVAKPGTFPLTGDMNVLQLIALGGGVLEYADSKNIVVMRTENGRQLHHKFNYNDVIKGKQVQQNILLKPGDTVVVP